MEVWHIDVGSSHPGAEGGPKGWAVRPLKWYASWVQTGVSQVGPYLSWAYETCEDIFLVREDWKVPASGVPVVVLTAAQGSYAGEGETLNASKRETPLKIRSRVHLRVREGPW